MDRTEARRLWRLVADGGLDDPGPDDLHSWLRDLARQLLEADGEPASDRPRAIVAAVGLAGREDPYAKLRELIDMFIAFAPEDVTQADEIARLATIARGMGLLRGTYADDEKKGRDLIRSLWPKKV